MVCAVTLTAVLWATTAWAAPVSQAIIFGSDSPSAVSAITGLASYNVPFIEYNTPESIAFATLPLYAGSIANFSMIVLGSGVIGFSADQWAQIYAYQNANNARLVSLYDVPGLGASYGYASSVGGSGVFTVSPADVIGSTNAGLPASYSINFDTNAFGTAYPATILNATAVTPVLTFSLGGVSSVGAAVYSFTPNQEQLSFFYQTAAWDLGNSPGIAKYTNEILVKWVSRGTYGYAPILPVVSHAVQVQTRALIISVGDGSEEYPATTFNSYGLSYDTLIVTVANMSDSPLNLEVTPNVLGKYSVIVLSSGQMTAKFANGSYLSTLTPWQWNQLHNYQQYYGVRLVAINDVPNAAYYAAKVAAVGGASGCSSTSLNVTPASSVFTDAAGLVSTWSLAAGDGIAGGSCNFPATIVDATAVTPVLNFENRGVAAAVIDFGRNQQQMSFFLPCGSWSITCVTIGNIWFQWATKGLYTGIRRIYFTPQIDDVFLTTDGNDENGKPVAFRISPADVQGIIDWMPDINSRLPTGSNLTVEMAYNGNGVMEILSNLANDPQYYINLDPDLTDTGLDWKKPIGTGQTLWNLTGVSTNWVKSALAADTLYNFFSAPGNLTSVTSKFLWCSHTFTHEIFNNNTYSDVFNELSFNFHLASKDLWGLDGQPFWSNKSMVTPGISGIFNGDALHALSDFGITGVVGDSSRNKTLNTERPLWWPLTTTVADNGFDGVTVIPRQALNIYFNTTNPSYNAKLYNNIYNTSYTFDDIIGFEIKRNLRTLALLNWAPGMFHQANLRNADVPVVTAGTKTGKLSLMQQWVEHVFGSFAKISNWPIITVKQDDLTQKFINRQIYETANVNVVQLVNVDANGVVVSGFNVTATKDTIAPITLPPSIGVNNITSLPAGATTEQIGIDSVTVWIPLTANAAPISILFGTPVPTSTTTTATSTIASTTETTTTIPTSSTETTTTTTVPTSSTETTTTTTVPTSSTETTTTTTVPTSSTETTTTTTVPTTTSTTTTSRTTTTNKSTTTTTTKKTTTTTTTKKTTTTTTTRKTTTTTTTRKTTTTTTTSKPTTTAIIHGTAGGKCTTNGQWACGNSLICSLGVWIQIGAVKSC
ncbi:UNVERIFIED_CONTAM: hypothetical protein HDU68_011669 [Siphonaria sp. JEL0065]|nr:hypothetical protein HDU68_011669 [Siphonaria sp. JEL0065]